MVKNILTVILLSASFVSAPLSCFADDATPQSTVGSVQGQVTDASGAVIPGATVTLFNSITNYKVTAKSDEAGNFKIVNVPFNTYKLSVDAPAFQSSEQTVDVHSAVPAQLSVPLAPQGLSEQVNVSADDTHMIEPDRTSAD